MPIGTTRLQKSMHWRTPMSFGANCFDSNNNYTRYWYGASKLQLGWPNVSIFPVGVGYNQTGTSYSTSWAGHHYGLVSGNNETVVVITAHLVTSGPVVETQFLVVKDIQEEMVFPTSDSGRDSLLFLSAFI